MDVSNFNSILKSAKITPNSRFLLLDQNNKIMASEGTAPNIDTVDLAEWKNDKRYIVQTVTLSQYRLEADQRHSEGRAAAGLEYGAKIECRDIPGHDLHARLVLAALFHTDLEAD